MLSILYEHSSHCVCFMIHSLSSISFIEKTAKRANGGRECKNKLLELEDAIISKVNNHNDSVRCHSHTGGAIHLSKAAPLRSKFA